MFSDLVQTVWQKLRESVFQHLETSWTLQARRFFETFFSIGGPEGPQSSVNGHSGLRPVSCVQSLQSCQTK